MFKQMIRDDPQTVLKTFSYTEDEKANDWHMVMDKTERYCIGAVNKIYEQYCFNKRIKLPAKSVYSLVDELIMLV